MLLSSIVRRQGHQVLTAANGAKRSKSFACNVRNWC